ncbi:HK97 gp10 family phage protein [Gemmata palustris]|uniref:HK97 gp10 family phage protein n=1 Tax=Gemmata palustris TaxID=2822762 RepID=UPI0036F4297E
MLEKLSKGLRNKAMRIALNKASSPVKAKIVAAAPNRFGFLKKSIRIRLQNYQNKQVWVSVIGPSRSFVRKKGKFKRGKKKGQPKNHRPANYSHLVDQGTRFIRGRHFIQRSYGRAFRSTFIIELRRQVELLLPKRK